MKSVLRILFWPTLSLMLATIGNGLFTSFISLRFKAGGESQEMVGVLASVFYAGVLLSSFYATRWITKLGHVRSMMLFCSINAGLILILATWFHPLFWGGVRFCSGITLGGLLIAIESWFLLASPTGMRSQVLSLYLAIFYAASSGGQLLLKLATYHPFLPFGIASSLSIAAVIPMILTKTEGFYIHPESHNCSYKEIFRASPFGFFGGMVSGMLLACLYGLGPVYGETRGLNLSDIGIFMSVVIFGGLSFQWPLGKWADATSRRRILVYSCLGAAICSGVIAFTHDLSWLHFLLLSWLFGGFSFVLYPLSMALTCETLREEQIITATGGFVLSYGIGAIIGPLVAPLFMEWSSTGGLFLFFSILCASLAVAGSLPMRARS